MQNNSSTERRANRRYPLATSISFYHDQSQRSFPGRCVDVSDGGMMMYIPASSPIQPGQAIRLTVGSVNRPEFAGLSEKPVDATIVRVDRHSLLTFGHLSVGVKFSPSLPS